MIGHYLLGLTTEEEDRVLTTTMRPGCYHVAGILGPCLVGVVRWPNTSEHRSINAWPPSHFPVAVARVRAPERCYDDLCDRFGVARINGLIRDRILANRLRRTLQPEPTLAGASA